jgi:hypothetical protein
MGRDCTDDHWPGEAGQLVFDKRANNGLNLAVLHLTNHMMAEDEMYGFLSYGDKDTFVGLFSSQLDLEAENLAILLLRLRSRLSNGTPNIRLCRRVSNRERRRQ